VRHGGQMLGKSPHAEWRERERAMLNVPENELFSAYLDGELTAEEQAEMERVLNTSPAARQLLDEFRALSATLQSLPVVELNEDLSGRVLRAAERQVLSGRSGTEQTEDASGRDPAPRLRLLRRILRGRTLWWSGVAVAVALLLALGDLNDRAERPGGNEDHVAVDSTISAAEDSGPPTVVAADSPPEVRTIESPIMEEPSRDEQANDPQTMIADSDNPSDDTLATDRPTPEAATTPDGAPRVAKPGDDLLIVKCDVSQKAADGRVLSKILAKRKIALLKRTDPETGKVFVEVDLTPTQLRALVADLESHREHFVAVSVPVIPGAAGPRIPSAAGPSKKDTGTGRVDPTGNDEGLSGSASATGGKSPPIHVKTEAPGTAAKSGQQTEKRVPKPGGLSRSSREEAKFRVRFELNVVATATGETGNEKSSAPSKQADAAPKSDK
jgi:hypothetical protein